MTTAIFIKTWSGDLPWLEYCMRSIRKYASGISEIVIAADESCIRNVYPMAGDAVVVSVADWDNGYIQQQWIKMNADLFADADQILFVDSDCIFHTPFSPESFMRDEKPVLMKTRYGNLGGAEAWRQITESFIGWSVEFEYMRRLPWMYHADSLRGFREMFPNLHAHLSSLSDRSFSEFNALGVFIERFESEKYYVTDTEVWVPESVAKQFWSWGGITPAIKSEIEGYLNAI